MKLNKYIYQDGLVKTALQNGGKLIPIGFELKDPRYASVMNPSICNIGTELLINFRVTNYSLYASVYNKYPMYNNYISYVKSHRNHFLSTKNFLAKYTDELELKSIDSLNLTVDDLSNDYRGLEDVRLINWSGELYLSGTRWSLKDNINKGRIQLTKLRLSDLATDLNRVIPIPDESSKCEKNWMPVADQPFTWIKWTTPTEVITYNQFTNTTSSKITNGYILSDSTICGGTQLVFYRGYYYAFGHSKSNNSNYGIVDYDYKAHLLIFNKNLQLIYASDPFKFMTDKVEFHNGLCLWKDKMIITFSVDDCIPYALVINPDILLTDETE